MIRIIKASTKKAQNLSYVKADAAEDARRGARERRQAAKGRKESKAAGKEIIDKIKNAEDPIEEAFEQLVPSQGKADTVAGEMVRAMMRILYRDYNDGDRFFEGYGIETCADAVAYLCDVDPDLEDDFAGVAERNLEGNAYTREIKKISDKVLDYLYANPNLFTENNTADYQDYDGEGFIEDNEWEPKYDYDCEIPGNVYYHLEKEDISEQDLVWELESWDSLRDTDISVESDYIQIYGLTRDQYDEIDGRLYDWLEQYGEDLDSEYGSEDDEEEEEYEEEEEEYEDEE